MALNRDKIGQEYPTYTYKVTRAKIHEYAAALGESDPRYFSDGDDCVAPPTFAACFTITHEGVVNSVFADEELGIHPALVHGSQAFVYGDRPMRPDDVIECTPRLTDIRARGRNEFLTLEIDGRFADTGDLAVRTENVIVFLGSAPEQGEEEGA